MKLLFDQNLSPKLAECFKNSFSDATHLQEIGLGDANDIVVWDFAKSNGFTIVTKDSDFNNIVSFFGFPPKVIWIRKGNCSTKQIMDLINKHIDAITNFINDTENGILIIF